MEVIFSFQVSSLRFPARSARTWMYRSWRSTATYLADAVLYAAGTAAVYYWLWR